MVTRRGFIIGSVLLGAATKVPLVAAGPEVEAREYYGNLVFYNYHNEPVAHAVVPINIKSNKYMMQAELSETVTIEAEANLNIDRIEWHVGELPPVSQAVGINLSAGDTVTFTTENPILTVS